MISRFLPYRKTIKIGVLAKKVLAELRIVTNFYYLCALYL